MLHPYARSLAECGRRQMEISDGLGGKRQATVAMACAAIQLKPPHVRRGLYEPRPLRVWVIRVWEVDAPVGAAPLEWILLTNVPVQSTADAWVRVSWDECRWIVEELHKAMKTGSGVEEMQFTTEAALQPMIAVLSVAALQLLKLRAASRQEDAATRPATEVVHSDYVAVLSAWRWKEVRLESSVHDFFYALARLGAARIASGTTHQVGWCCGAAG